MKRDMPTTLAWMAAKRQPPFRRRWQCFPSIHSSSLFLLSSVRSFSSPLPPVRESPTTTCGGGSASYVGCKGHPWGNCTEVARESATYESWESGSASECFLRSMLHLFVTPWILLQIRLIFSAILGKALTEINETPSTSPRDQNRQIRRFGDDLPCRHSSSGWGKSHVGRRGELLQLRPQQWSNGGRLSGKFNLHFVKNK